MLPKLTEGGGAKAQRDKVKREKLKVKTVFCFFIFFIAFRKKYLPLINRANMRVWCENYEVFVGVVLVKSL
jgi:hypothetical protein